VVVVEEEAVEVVVVQRKKRLEVKGNIYRKDRGVNETNSPI
jgi:hypothetical protein